MLLGELEGGKDWRGWVSARKWRKVMGGERLRENTSKDGKNKTRMG